MTTPLLTRIKNRAAFEIFRIRQPASVRVAGKRILPNYETYHKHVLRGLAGGWHEACEVRQIERLAREGHIRKGMRVLDIGAGLGLVTMKIADLVGDDNVVGYEADPNTAADCRRNLQANGHAIQIIDAAMIDGDDSIVTLRVSGALCGSSLLPVSDMIEERAVQARCFVEEIERLDPQLILIDVEGSEGSLLRSVRDFRSVELMLIEVHPHITGQAAIEKMFDHVLDHGFRSLPGEFEHIVTFVRVPIFEVISS